MQCSGKALCSHQTHSELCACWPHHRHSDGAAHAVISITRKYIAAPQKNNSILFFIVVKITDKLLLLNLSFNWPYLWSFSRLDLFPQNRTLGSRILPVFREIKSQIPAKENNITLLCFLIQQLTRQNSPPTLVATNKRHKNSHLVDSSRTMWAWQHQNGKSCWIFLLKKNTIISSGISSTTIHKSFRIHCR